MNDSTTQFVKLNMRHPHFGAALAACKSAFEQIRVNAFEAMPVNPNSAGDTCWVRTAVSADLADNGAVIEIAPFDQAARVSHEAKCPAWVGNKSLARRVNDSAEVLL